MIVFLGIVILGGAAVIWHDLPVWMYAALVVISGWRMSLRRRERAERRRADEAGPAGPPPGEDDRPSLDVRAPAEIIREKLPSLRFRSGGRSGIVRGSIRRPLMTTGQLVLLILGLAVLVVGIAVLIGFFWE